MNERQLKIRHSNMLKQKNLKEFISHLVKKWEYDYFEQDEYKGSNWELSFEDLEPIMYFAYFFRKGVIKKKIIISFCLKYNYGDYNENVETHWFNEIYHGEFNEEELKEYEKFFKKHIFSILLGGDWKKYNKLIKDIYTGVESIHRTNNKQLINIYVLNRNKPEQDFDYFEQQFNLIANLENF